MFEDKEQDELAKKISKDIIGYDLYDVLIVLGTITQLAMEELPVDGQVAYMKDIRKQLEQHIDKLDNMH